MMKKGYLIIGNFFIFEIVEKKLYKSKVIPDMEIKKNFKIYNNKTVLSASRARFENFKWTFYDENENNVNTDGFRIAVTDGYDIKPVMYLIEKFNSLDEEIIKELDKTVSKKSFDLYANRLKKIVFDFDGDEKVEKICTMSNFIFGERDGKNYMFLEKNDVIADKIVDYGVNIFHIIELLEINKKVYVLVLKSLGDPITYKDENLFIYTIQNNKFVKCNIDMING